MSWLNTCGRFLKSEICNSVIVPWCFDSGNNCIWRKVQSPTPNLDCVTDWGVSKLKMSRTNSRFVLNKFWFCSEQKLKNLFGQKPSNINFVLFYILHRYLDHMKELLYWRIKSMFYFWWCSLITNQLMTSIIWWNSILLLETGISKREPAFVIL